MMRAPRCGARRRTVRCCMRIAVRHQVARNAGAGDPLVRQMSSRYSVEMLRRYPTMNVPWRCGARREPRRASTGRCAFSATAIAEGKIAGSQPLHANSAPSVLKVSPNPPSSIIEVAIAQIRFILRQHQTRHQERALDTYVSEPFRAIDWQLQGLTPSSMKTFGTPDEWAHSSSSASRRFPRFSRLLAADRGGREGWTCRRQAQCSNATA